ncbi:hypothetical protein Tco_0520312 [Tanacetum coccineum]
MGILYTKPNALGGVPFDETSAEPGRAKHYTISGAIRRTATISPVKTESIIVKLPNLLFQYDKRERRFTPPGFLTLTPLPGPNVGELPPITASTFTTRSPNNTPLTNRTSTSATPNLVISLTFVEANYEEYDEEREMDPRTARSSKKLQTGIGAGLKGNPMAGGLHNKERKKSPREILAIEKAAKAFEQPPHMIGNRRSRDMTKYYHFHEDHVHETNQCQELRHQIEEVVKSNSPYNLLLRRTTMQKMGIVVSTIHAALKFHTPCVIATVFSTYEPNKVEEGQKKVKESVLEVTKYVLNCVDVEERIIVNDKHPEQTVVIGKQLPTSFKRKLQDLL